MGWSLMLPTQISHFEHLDFLWGNDVNKLVFPYVFDALNSYSDPTHPKEKPSLFKTTRHGSLVRPDAQQPPSYSEDERLVPNKGGVGGGEQSPGDGIEGERLGNEENAKGGSASQQRPVGVSPVAHDASATNTASSSSPTPLPRQIPIPRLAPSISQQSGRPSSPSPLTNHPPSGTNETPSSTPLTSASRVIADALRRPKSGSSSSLDSTSSSTAMAARPGIGSEGISLGMGRPVGGVISRDGSASSAFPGRSGTGRKRRS
jgi:lysosomal acid lipase/cholesteryl ester hydrolase